MNRRDFTKLSALTTAGLFLPKPILATSGKVHVPESMIRLSDDLFSAKVIEFGYYPKQNILIDRRLLAGSLIGFIPKPENMDGYIDPCVAANFGSAVSVGRVKSLRESNNSYLHNYTVKYGAAVFALVRMEPDFILSCNGDFPALSPVIDYDSGKLISLFCDFSVTAQSHYDKIRD